jgi:ABC-type bacteriocin/lantibiotic exporter with double-glycine peptidase domain
MKTLDPTSPNNDIDSSYILSTPDGNKFKTVDLVYQFIFILTLLGRIAKPLLFVCILGAVLSLVFLIIWLSLGPKNNKLYGKDESFTKQVTEEKDEKTRLKALDALPGYTEHREEYDKFNDKYKTISIYAYSLGAILVTPILYLSLSQ